jgi:hypothetical protein
VLITLPVVNLTFGDYVVEAQVGGARPNSDRVFVSILARVQPQGRSLFAIPFVLAPSQTGASREVDLFGGVAFRLARWDATYDR